LQIVEYIMIMCEWPKSSDNGIENFQMKMAGVYEEVIRYRVRTLGQNSDRLAARGPEPVSVPLVFGELDHE
jgi:hypothetical protein